MFYPRWRVAGLLLVALGVVVVAIKPDQNGTIAWLTAPVWLLSFVASLACLLTPAPPRDLLFCLHLATAKKFFGEDLQKAVDRHTELDRNRNRRIGQFVRAAALLVVLLSPMAYLYEQTLLVEARMVDILLRQEIRRLVDVCNLHNPRGFEALTVNSAVGLGRLSTQGPIGWLRWLRGRLMPAYRRSREPLALTLLMCHRLQGIYSDGETGRASVVDQAELRRIYRELAMLGELDRIGTRRETIDGNAGIKGDAAATVLLAGRLAWIASTAPEDTMDDLRLRAVQLAKVALKLDPTLAAAHSILASEATIRLGDSTLTESEFVSAFAEAGRGYESASARADNPAMAARLKNNMANLRLRASIELLHRSASFREGVRAEAAKRSHNDIAGEALAGSALELLRTALSSLRTSIEADPGDRVYLMTRAQLYAQLALAFELGSRAPRLTPSEASVAKSVLGAGTAAERRFVCDELLRRVLNDVKEAGRRGAPVETRIGGPRERWRSGFAIADDGRHAWVLEGLEEALGR